MFMAYHTTIYDIRQNYIYVPKNKVPRVLNEVDVFYHISQHIRGKARSSLLTLDRLNLGCVSGVALGLNNSYPF